MKFTIPIRTGTGLNLREHWAKRAKRVRREKLATLVAHRESAGNVLKWAMKYEVKLTRVSPSGKPMDDDNLPGALKAIRDQLAKNCGVDDGNVQRIQFIYGQRKGPWGVEVEITGT